MGVTECILIKMFLVVYWAPSLIMTYSMCQCGGVDVWVISWSLLVPAVVCEASTGLCMLVNNSWRATRELPKVFPVTCHVCSVRKSWSYAKSFTIAEIGTQMGHIFLHVLFTSEPLEEHLILIHEVSILFRKHCVLDHVLERKKIIKIVSFSSSGQVLQHHARDPDWSGV